MILDLDVLTGIYGIYVGVLQESPSSLNPWIFWCISWEESRLTMEKNTSRRLRTGTSPRHRTDPRNQRDPNAKCQAAARHGQRKVRDVNSMGN